MNVFARSLPLDSPRLDNPKPVGILGVRGQVLRRLQGEGGSQVINRLWSALTLYLLAPGEGGASEGTLRSTFLVAYVGIREREREVARAHREGMCFGFGTLMAREEVTKRQGGGERKYAQEREK